MYRSSKACLSCGVAKNVSIFGSDAQREDGMRQYCKPCQNTKNRAARNGRSEERAEALKSTRARWARSNKDKVVGYSTAWREANPEQTRIQRLASDRRNRARLNAANSKRRADQLRAMPTWADEERIREIYEFAQEFRDAGFDIDVDHIVPLKGKLVCGLHTHTNLRPCLASANRRKGNHFDNRQEN